MNNERKTERKRKRFAARLKSSKGVTCTDLPGPNMVLCNVGEATGLDKDSIYQILSEKCPTVSLPKFIAEKGETYSFLVFSNTEDAVSFYKTCNGREKLDNGPVLCLNYVENVPNDEVICPYENPKGLTVLKDFISVEEENNFINLFDWEEGSESNCLKNRQVKHYGYDFRYGSNDVDLSSPLSEKIPRDCDILWSRLKERGINVSQPDQLTVNKYKPGQGIPSHVDKHSPFGDTIFSLSLGSSVVMDWKHHSGKQVPVEVPSRSLLIMQDEARYDWQHGIQPRLYDPVIEHRVDTSDDTGKSFRVVTSEVVPRATRISLTFRRTRSGPCQCEYRTLCDSVKCAGVIEEKVASQLEELHVHQVYEQIKGHFSTTRHKPWPRVVEFMEKVPSGAIVVDLGCGNGKNILRRNDILQIAAERSDGLLLECQQHVKSLPAAQCVRLDLLAAPLRDASSDAIICIAVIHHFTTKVRRIQAIRTIARLLRTGGRALITVWATDQSKSKYLLKDKTPDTSQVRTVCGVELPVHQNRTQFQHQDLLVPWKLKASGGHKSANVSEQTFLRYYHVFEEGELEELCSQVSDLQIEDSFYEEGNWCVVCKKI